MSGEGVIFIVHQPAKSSMAAPFGRNNSTPVLPIPQNRIMMTAPQFLGDAVIRILIIGFGGFLGAISRYYVSGWVQHLSQSVHFPYGTLAVNVLGSFLLGFLMRYTFLQQVFSPEMRLLLFIGFLGAFTTFSTFSLETFNLLEDGAVLPALANMGANILLGLAAVWLGQVLALAWAS
jgi:CrcB protein